MAEEQGQAAMQPGVDDRAISIMADIIKQEEAPREEPKEEPKPEETEAEAEPAEETKAEETPEETEEEPQQPEWDWETVQGLKRKFTVKAEDGSDEEVELTPEEVQKGIMLERSYRQKTAQLAKERESVNLKVKEAVEPKLKEYEEKLQVAEQVIWKSLAPEMQNTDWNTLAKENPAEWAQRYQQVQALSTNLAQVQGELKKVQEERVKEQQTLIKRQAEEAVEHLKTALPGWSNDLYGKILKSGVEFYGFKPEEVNAITDHRAIEVLHDAMQFRALKAKPLVDKRVLPKAPKVAKPGTAEKPDASAEQWKKSMAKLQKTGHEKDAFLIAKQLLEREGK